MLRFTTGNKSLFWQRCSVALLAGFLVTGLTACGPGGAGANQDVWNNYDVRQIENSSKDTDYYTGQYQDNDSYYTPPTSYGCSPADIMGVGCE